MNVLPVWLRKWLRPRCAPVRRARLTFETLEDRRIPSASSVAGPVSYATWQQQTFRIDDTTVSTAAPTAAATAQSAAPVNDSFGSLIGLNQVLAGSADRGAGYSVAVIDTGINYNDPNLGGGWGKRVVAGWNFVNNTSDPMDDNGHGTFVASEIASSSPTLSGVAPDANLIALKVLDSTGSGSYGNVQSALDWVVAHQAQYHIVAINLSLGSGNYTVNPYTYLESDFATLKADGVFIAVAAGNDYYTVNSQPGLAYPAVSSDVVSVGAVWTGSFGAVSWASGARDYSTAADQIASFSQRSAALSILAPGAILSGDGLSGGTVTMAGTSMATPVVAGAALLLHEALVEHGLSADANQDYILQLMQSTGKLVIDANHGTDNVSHTGLSFRRLDLDAAMTALGATSTGPSIGAIADQATHMGQSLSVTITATAASGGALAWQASVLTPGQDAYLLDQALGLGFAGSYFYNLDGLGEKWLWSSVLGGLAVCILPDGTLRRYDAAGASAIMSDRDLLGRVDPAYFTDPSLLTNAPPGGTAPATLSSAGTQLTITPSAGYVGPLYVVVTAADGGTTTFRSFLVDVTDTAPLINAIADQSVGAGQAATATVTTGDADGDPVTWQAQALTPAQAAFDLDDLLKLSYTGNYYYNLHGLGEKWLWSSAIGGLAVCILPDGTLRRYDPAGNTAMLGEGDLLGRVNPSCYADPALLTNAAAPASFAAPAAVSVSGGQLTVTPVAGYTGALYVQVSVSDGARTSREVFAVNVGSGSVVVPAPSGTPLINAIGDQSTTAGKPATVTVTASNANGSPANWQARAMTPAQAAYALDQQLGLSYTGNYYYNLHGLGEKWLWSSTLGGLVVCILPDGTVRRYDPAGNTAMLSDRNLLGRVDPSYYADPALLCSAPAPASSSNPATLSISGSPLSVTPSSSYHGTLYVEVMVTQGSVTVRKVFAVAVG